MFNTFINSISSFSKPTKAVWRYTDEGEEVRVSVRSGRIIPMPEMAEETYDYKEKRYYTGKFKSNLKNDYLNCTFLNM